MTGWGGRRPNWRHLWFWERPRILIHKGTLPCVYTAPSLNPIDIYLPEWLLVPPPRIYKTPTASTQSNPNSPIQSNLKRTSKHSTDPTSPIKSHLKQYNTPNMNKHHHSSNNLKQASSTAASDIQHSATATSNSLNAKQYVEEASQINSSNSKPRDASTRRNHGAIPMDQSLTASSSPLAGLRADPCPPCLPARTLTVHNKVK